MEEKKQRWEWREGGTDAVEEVEEGSDVMVGAEGGREGGREGVESAPFVRAGRLGRPCSRRTCGSPWMRRNRSVEAGGG